MRPGVDVGHALAAGECPSQDHHPPICPSTERRMPPSTPGCSGKLTRIFHLPRESRGGGGITQLRTYRPCTLSVSVRSVYRQGPVRAAGRTLVAREDQRGSSTRRGSHRAVEVPPNRKGTGPAPSPAAPSVTAVHPCHWASFDDCLPDVEVEGDPDALFVTKPLIKTMVDQPADSEDADPSPTFLPI